MSMVENFLGSTANLVENT